MRRGLRARPAFLVERQLPTHHCHAVPIRAYQCGQKSPLPPARSSARLADHRRVCEERRGQQHERPLTGRSISVLSTNRHGGRSQTDRRQVVGLVGGSGRFRPQSL